MCLHSLLNSELIRRDQFNGLHNSSYLYSVNRGSSPSISVFNAILPNYWPYLVDPYAGGVSTRLWKHPLGLRENTPKDEFIVFFPSCGVGHLGKNSLTLLVQPTNCSVPYLPRPVRCWWHSVEFFPVIGLIPDSSPKGRRKINGWH